MKTSRHGVLKFVATVVHGNDKSPSIGRSTDSPQTRTPVVRRMSEYCELQARLAPTFQLPGPSMASTITSMSLMLFGWFWKSYIIPPA